MKPRIFIAMHYMEIGGAESSLIGLLEALDPQKVDVDLFIYSHQGVFMKAIPDYINLLPENKKYSMFEKPLKQVVSCGYWRIALARIVAKLKCRLFVNETDPTKLPAAIYGYTGSEVSKEVPDIMPEVEYDLAISYMNPHDFVLKHVRAKKKLAWIHQDYSKIMIDAKLELPVWGGYDKIVSISPDVTTTFLQTFPSLADKILECENILPMKLINGRANERYSLLDGIPEGFKFKESGVLTLCSIGRIGFQKNYDNVPYMAKALKELFNSSTSSGQALNDDDNDNCRPDGSMDSTSSPQVPHKPYTINHFHWYIVGPGDHSTIDALSRELGVDDVVTFLGPSDNPYPFIKDCDIYVHPSRYEGKSIVVREAQVLCKPIIITDYPTAPSQIKHGEDGIICGMNNVDVANAIYDLAINKEKQERIVNYIKTHDYSGRDEIEKLYSLI